MINIRLDNDRFIELIIVRFCKPRLSRIILKNAEVSFNYTLINHCYLALHKFEIYFEVICYKLYQTVIENYFLIYNIFL
jgi:hypothetical protein